MKYKDEFYLLTRVACAIILPFLIASFYVTWTFEMVGITNIDYHQYLNYENQTAREIAIATLIFALFNLYELFYGKEGD